MNPTKIKVKTFAEIGADEKLELIAKHTLMPVYVLGEVCDVVSEEHHSNEWVVKIFVTPIEIYQTYYIPKPLCEVVA